MHTWKSAHIFRNDFGFLSEGKFQNSNGRLCRPNAGRISSKIQRQRDTRNSGRYQSIGNGKRGENRSPKTRNLPLFRGKESISVKTSQIGYCSNCSYPCISSKGTQSKRLAQVNSIDQFDKRQASDIECR